VGEEENMADARIPLFSESEFTFPPKLAFLAEKSPAMTSPTRQMYQSRHGNDSKNHLIGRSGKIKLIL